MTNLLDNKIVLGVSGGVDSTAAALLLKKEGYDVTGLYFDISENNEEGINKAKKVADEIGIDLIVKNVSKEFGDCVIGNFIDEYTNGRTPNPCIVCNPNIKFKILIETADEIGAKYIATGHYAQIGYSENQSCYTVKVPTNVKKDQSYMLYRLESEVIERIIFPLEKYESKEEIRNIARNMNMSNADDKDSQEICFIDDNKSYIDFLHENGIKNKKGNFIDRQGNILGQHQGVMNYTYGQRKGLGIALGKPVFVTDIDVKNNTVTLGENQDLFATDIVLQDVFFTATGSNKVPDFAKDTKLKGKIRYSAPMANMIIKDESEGLVTVSFEEPQRAATPGQSLVIYKDNEVIGGGIIKNTIK